MLMCPAQGTLQIRRTELGQQPNVVSGPRSRAGIGARGSVGLINRHSDGLDLPNQPTGIGAGQRNGRENFAATS